MPKWKPTVRRSGKEIAQYILPYLYSYATGLIGIFYAFRFNQLVAFLLSNSKEEIVFSDAYAWDSISLINLIIYGIILIAVILVTQHLSAKEIKKRWVPWSFIIIVVIQALVYLGTMLYIGQFT